MITDGILFTAWLCFALCGKRKRNLHQLMQLLSQTITRNTNLITDIAVVSTGDLLCVAAEANAVYRVTTSSIDQSNMQLMAGDQHSSAGFSNGVGTNGTMFFNPCGITLIRIAALRTSLTTGTTAFVRCNYLRAV
ncbi:Hypothetical protein, putative [Bodo saltans]|uniref:Uncharacterized protein n=1 Tax=Bodo saltans TaxID=75058 RepID=A0A0S4JS53_BODSA|nr:Hypothetical protein, putative [Bodo saltans]|eukprot:CUG93628.1 Hypothetical protein, putative [Bodo saltans]